jgi:arylformamidase
MKQEVRYLRTVRRPVALFKIIRLATQTEGSIFPERNGAFLYVQVWKENLLKILDISVSLSAGLPVWPGDPRIVLERYRSISEGNASNDSMIACSVHSGTHVDAPAHFIENGASVEQLPLNILIGPAIVVEVPTTEAIKSDFLETLRLPPGTTRLLFKTRNSTLWEDPNHNFNPDYVALSADAALWITRSGIRLVGIDYLSVQMFEDSEHLTHRTLLEAGLVIVEGLNLQNVRPGSYQLICLPIKLAGSDGAPARAVLIEE